MQELHEFVLTFPRGLILSLLKVAIVSKLSREARALAERISLEPGMKIVGRGADAIVTLGGDGTLLLAERAFPGIPKVPARAGGSLCLSCVEDDVVLVLRRHALGKAKVVCVRKLRAEIFRGGKKVASFTGANDIVIRNSEPYHALRFSVSVGKSKGSFIGDGLVASTFFGSTGYFRSVSGKSFKRGFGFALNNPTVRKGPFHSNTGLAEFSLGRNGAVACADNGKGVFLMRAGDVAKFSKSKEEMRLLR